MNTIKKIDEKTYELTLENGTKYLCSVWTEKKTRNGKYMEMDHVIIPKEAREICGRTYIRTSIIGEYYEFEDKTTHREGMGNGGWRGRLTEEEKVRLEELESEIEQIKQTAMSRQMTEEEKILREIEKLQRRLAEQRGLK